MLRSSNNQRMKHDYACLCDIKTCDLKVVVLTITT